MKTLIVEDDPISSLPLQEFLNSYGPTQIVVNGEEAVETVRVALEAGEPYDLICLDIMLPEMDGHEVLQQIRALEEARDISLTCGAKIVMTTTLGDIKNVAAAYRELCDGYLVKPIGKAKLLDELRRLRLIE